MASKALGNLTSNNKTTRGKIAESNYSSLKQKTAAAGASVRNAGPEKENLEREAAAKSKAFALTTASGFIGER